ncbi:MAG TPA: hypothetical protein ENJ46_02735 [Hellea balneolensis]|uniref:Uncharacterized protein n=1 Tax=Hellea balneolensis TaxID=287478 RepID=A0A7C3GD30_9PROT|nr:hypothetical protein [Hellea balneolensis]
MNTTTTPPDIVLESLECGGISPIPPVDNQQTANRLAEGGVKAIGVCGAHPAGEVTENLCGQLPAAQQPTMTASIDTPAQGIKFNGPGSG